MSRKLHVFIVGWLVLAGTAYGEKRDVSRHFFASKGALTEADSRPAQDIGKQYLADSAQRMGLSATDLEGAYLAKSYQTAHNGVTHLVYRQRFLGVEVYNGEWVVNVDRDGRVLNAGGLLYPRPGGLVLPEAAPPVSMDGSKVESQRLVWYGRRGVLYPAWAMHVADSNGIDAWEAIVDADSQVVLAKFARTVRQKGLVFTKESPQANPTPGVRVTAPPEILDRLLIPLVGDPKASPLGWVTDGSTSGNNATTGENPNGVSFLQNPFLSTAAGGDFSYPLQVGFGAPNPRNYTDAINTNLFYWVNRAHDLFYEIGFDEAAGNFQTKNLSGQGVGGDALLAYTHYGAQSAGFAQLDNAFFSWKSTDDGTPVMMAMFLATGFNTNNLLPGDMFTDSALDAGVIVHEYTHGVSGRLVRRGYETFQGGAMGEAWSDFFALEFLTPEGAPVTGEYPVGEYFEQLWGAGIRTRPYSTNKEINPLTLGDLGHVIPFPEVHADGEIWAQALWELRANLIEQFGEKEGRRRARLLVIDGMKLAVPAPTFIDARDAILLADRVDFKGASQEQLWAAFAKRGLGALAFSDDPDSTHVAVSFDVPSATGKLKLYEDKYVLGEPVLVLLSDGNLKDESALVQVTSSSGDVEDLRLQKTGSVYVGAIGVSTSGSVVKGDSVLQLIPADFVGAYYVDYATAGGGSDLIETSVPTMPPYAASQSAALPYEFKSETPLNLKANIFSTRRVNLPFQFPFFGKKYQSAYIYTNGMIAFEQPTSVGCTDLYTLASYNAIAPLWTLSRTNGTAQSGEDVYVSQQSPGSYTVRWAAETLGGGSGTFGQPPEPINVAATIYNDGRIVYQYGPGNKNISGGVRISGCPLPAPTVGIANGHGTYFQIAFPHNGRPTLENAATVNFDPPSGFSSIPTGKIESPVEGATEKNVFTLKGYAFDENSPVSRVDLKIDGVPRRTIALNQARPDACGESKSPNCPAAGFQVNLDAAALKLAAGSHTLQLQATNTRGASAYIPENALSFTIEAAANRLPVGKVESPAEGETVSEVMAVKGWAYALDLAITSADVQIDGVTYTPAIYGQPRPDACPDPPVPPGPPNCPRAGFTAFVDTMTGYPPLPNGPHTLQVRVRDESGRLTLIPETPINFTVDNVPTKPPVTVVTAPVNGEKWSGTVTVSGFAYGRDKAEIGRLLLLVDGSSYGSIPYGLPAPEACAALPDVPACPGIGFERSFNTRVLSNGNHTVQVYAEDDFGLFSYLPVVSINVAVDNK